MYMKYLSVKRNPLLTSIGGRLFRVFHGSRLSLRSIVATYAPSKFISTDDCWKVCGVRNMENVTRIWTGPLPPDSPYVKPYRFFYIQNGVEKNWDLLKVHDSVSIIIYHKTRNTLVFVKQFRPAVYHSIVINEIGDKDIDLVKFPPSLGVTVELCAGIVDKKKSFQEIAIEEVLEECGYNVSAENMEEIMTYRSGVGSSGAIQTLYYCAVTDADKASIGGGIDDELIEVIELTIDEAREMVKLGASTNSPPSCLLGIMWFLANKLK